MHSGGREQHAGMRGGDVMGGQTLGFARTRDDHLCDAGCPGPLENLLEIVTKAVVTQISADVDELRGMHHDALFAVNHRKTSCRPRSSA